MISFTVNVSNDLDATLSALISALNGKESKDVNEAAGIAARNSAIQYHREFDKSGGWRGKRYLGTGPEGSHFGADVARGWQLEEFSTGGATISNDAAYYEHKVNGGTIKPVRAKALTIPLIREAKGIRAAVYSQNTGHRLFTIKGKNALFERIEGTTTVSRGRRQAGGTSIRTSQIRPVYALVKSVTQGPWPGALPPDDLIGDAYVDQVSRSIEDIIRNA